MTMDTLRRREGSHRRRATVAVCLLVAAVLSSGLQGGTTSKSALAAAASLSGTVSNTLGKPVPNATVIINNIRSQADSGGHYTLNVDATRRSVVILWALGYTEEVLTVDLSGISGNVTLDFGGSAGLSKAFTNHVYGAKLSKVPATVPASTRTIRLHGTTSVSVFSKVGVTLPTGRVKLYRLHVTGRSFTTTVPLSSNGVYTVEILTASALPMFNVLIFHGVAPQLPTPPNFPVDPAPPTAAKLAAACFALLNIARTQAGLPALAENAQLHKAAQVHSKDLVLRGYFLIHPHIGSDGSTPKQRVLRTGFKANSVGEDVGNAKSAESMMITWLNSPLHRNNILGNYRSAGVGVLGIRGSLYFTVDFAR